jgi:hypothetical protein
MRVRRRAASRTSNLVSQQHGGLERSKAVTAAVGMGREQSPAPLHFEAASQPVT